LELLLKASLYRQARYTPATRKIFDIAQWECKQVTLIAKSSLPFQFLAHQDFIDLVAEAQLCPSKPVLLSPKTARRRLQMMVKEGQQKVLSALPDGAKLSIALDCWTSPFHQAFMAVTGYFVDCDWKFREILLGFEPLQGTHSGTNLGATVFALLQQHAIVNRVLAVTTDNASNNTTTIESIQQSIDSLELPDQIPIVRIPCLAHVIQLSLRELLGSMKVDPKNDTTDRQWSEDQEKSLRAIQKQHEITYTLSKVSSIKPFSRLLSNNIMHRFAASLSLSMPVLNAVTPS
jgi:hypothetical protein